MSDLNPAALLAERPVAEIGRLRMRALVLGAIGLAGCAYGVIAEPTLFAQSYLIAFIFWTGITVGSLALLMVQYLSGGGWGMFARRVFEASTRTWPLMAILFLPIASIWMPTLFEWVRPEAAHDPVIQDKAIYLNRSFFLIRAALFFGIWGTLTFLLNRWSKEQDVSAPRLPGPKDGRMRVLSGPGLVLYMITVTFMAVDWIMSLAPHFTSTIFGILLLGGQGLSTLAFTIIILALLSRAKPISEVARPDLFHDLGKLMLAFVMLWAYFNVSQLIIIYQGNLPEEVPWYTTRVQGGWGIIAAIVLLGHFALPFALLLSRDLKRHARSLSMIAIWVLVMRVIDLVWNIGPIFRPEGSLHWLDFAAVLGMGGLWLTVFFINLGGRALVPAHDPYFKDAMAHGGH